MPLSLSALEIGLLVLSLELAIALFVVTRTALKARAAVTRADSRAAESLLDHVQEKVQTRRQALELVLRDAYSLEEEELAKFADEFMAREEEFYKVIADTFKGRDYGRLVNLTEDLNKVVAPCIGLVPKNQVKRSDADALKTQLDELEMTNERLRRDLQDSTTSLEQMTAEYNAAFERAAREEMERAAEEAASDGAAPAEGGAGEVADAVTDALADGLGDAGAASNPDAQGAPAASEQKKAPEPRPDATGMFEVSAEDIDSLLNELGTGAGDDGEGPEGAR